MDKKKEGTYSSTLTRRAFLAAATTTACVSALGAPNSARVVPRKISPNEKLNVAGIGVGGKGIHDIMSYKRENVVALCDVDWKRAEEAFYRIPEAKNTKITAKCSMRWRTGLIWSRWPLRTIPTRRRPIWP